MIGGVVSSAKPASVLTRMGQPGQAARHGQHHALDQDLGEHIHRCRADGFADADLPDTLGDAREHDIDDADPADQKADPGDEHAADALVVDGQRDVVGELLLRLELEILQPLVRAHQHVANLLQRRREQ